MYDKLYNPLVFPFLFLKTSIHPSRNSLLNLFSSQDNILSNSSNLSFEK